MEGLSNIEVSELSRLAPIGPDWPRLAPTGPDKVVAASAPQTLPSTRAGGQDDVSSNKLPQIIVFIISTCTESVYSEYGLHLCESERESIYMNTSMQTKGT